LAAIRLPKADLRIIATCRGHGLAIRREGDADRPGLLGGERGSGVAIELPDLLPRGHVPEPDGLIVPPRSENLAVRGVDQGANLFLKVFVFADCFPLPQL